MKIKDLIPLAERGRHGHVAFLLFLLGLFAESIAHHDHVTGRFAPDGDVVRYAQGLAWVYGHYQTTDATAWRHEIAQRTAQLMDPVRLVRKIIAVYRDGGRGSCELETPAHTEGVS